MIPLIPAFEIGLCNGWLFMLVYPLQWLAVLVVPKHVAERTGHPEDMKASRRDKIMGWLTQIFWVGASLYSIFVPFYTGTVWFYLGLASFVIGLAVVVIATVSVSRTPAGEPFGGIYRYSRHPMYLSMFFIYTGVSLAAVSWIFLAITVIAFSSQERVRVPTLPTSIQGWSMAKTWGSLSSGTGSLSSKAPNLMKTFYQTLRSQANRR